MQSKPGWHCSGWPQQSSPAPQHAPVQHWLADGQHAGVFPGGHASPPPGHTSHRLVAGSVHAKPSSQQTFPHTRLMLGQQIEPLTQIPLQHWPLQHCWKPEQQWSPHWRARSGQHSVPCRQWCDGQQVDPHRSSGLQHWSPAAHTWVPVQHWTPHSGPASGAQQRLIFGSTQRWPIPQKNSCVDDGTFGSLQHADPGGAQ